MAKAPTFDADSFQNAIDQRDRPVLVDFYADWCPPCRALGPTIDALAAKFEGRAIVGKVNVDANQDLARRFGISSIPTVLVFREGDVVDRFVGIASASDLTRSLEAAGDTAAA